MGFGARSFNPGDVLPPTVPVVTATRTGPQEITVTWGASSDASGVARYYIREYGVPGSEVEVIGPNRSRAYSGLTPNTAYRYEVRAQDIYGNISLYGASALVSTLPINVAPVWSVIPLLALPYNTGGTRDVKPYVADANGDPITISLVNPPAGYTISNGVINATASVAGATLTLSASDGLLTATTTMSVTVSAAPPILSTSFPRLGAMQISSGNWLTYQYRRELTALYDIAVIGMWRQWNGGTITSGSLSGQALTLRTLPAWIRELNPNIKLYKYSQNGEINYSEAAWTFVCNKLFAENGTGGLRDWWLRKAGTLDNSGFNNAGQRIETWPGAARVNISAYPDRDAQGYSWNEWIARYWNAASTDTGSWVTTGWGYREADWTGIYTDNQYLSYAYGVTADYNDDGTNEEGSANTTKDLVVVGHRNYRAAWKALHPTRAFGANISSYWNASSGEIDYAAANMAGINEHGWQEWGTKSEMYQGWTVMMSVIQRWREIVGADGIFVVMHHIGPDSEPASFRGRLGTARSYPSWHRYGMASALMFDVHYCPIAEGGYNLPPWYDEMEHDLGMPVDPEQTGSYNSSLYGTVRVRRFDSGIAIVNPLGNGSRTIPLPSAGTGFKWCRLPATTRPGATPDSTVNNGSTTAITSVTLSEREGLILRKVSTIDTSARILHTNFGPGLSLAYTLSYTYTGTTWPPPNEIASVFSPTSYDCGDHAYLVGTDSTTGQVFSKYSPRLWGTYRASPDWGALDYGMLAAINSRTQAGESLKSPSQVFEHDFVTGLVGPAGTGITTAWRRRYKTAPYRQPDQSGYIFYPDTDQPQGMYYQRMYIKLLPGLWNTGLQWRTLAGWKARNNINRFMLTLIKNDGIRQNVLRAGVDIQGGEGQPSPVTFSNLTNRCAWSQGFNTHQFYSWDWVSYGNSGVPGFSYSPSAIAEDTWYKLELATGHYASTPYVWAAINGVEFFRFTGQLFHDGANRKLDRIFLAQLYSDFNTTDPGLLYTGLEVWEAWPGDAAPHSGL